MDKLELSKGGIIGKTIAFCRRFARLRLTLYAANASYFIVMSLFPMLVLILHILRFTQLDAVDLMDVLADILPEALLPEAQKLVNNTYAHTTRAMASMSAIGAIWSASMGTYGLLRGLNQIYGVHEDRGFLYTRSISVLYTFGFLLVLLMTLLFNVFGQTLAELLKSTGCAGVLLDIVDLRYVLMLSLQVVIFTGMYCVLPNVPNPFSRSYPGAIVTALGWMMLSRLFSFYVENLNSYSAIYGSVYAVALGMLWLYLCILILFFGGVVNKLLSDRKKS